MWKIYYTDGSVFSNEDGEPWDAPRTGVQIVVVPDDELGRRCIDKEDYVCWHDDAQTWVGHDLSGLFQYLDAPGCIKVVLRGYYLPRSKWMEIHKRAIHDEGLPKWGRR